MHGDLFCKFCHQKGPKWVKELTGIVASFPGLNLGRIHFYGVGISQTDKSIE